MENSSRGKNPKRRRPIRPIITTSVSYGDDITELHTKKMQQLN